LVVIVPLGPFVIEVSGGAMSEGPIIKGTGIYRGELVASEALMVMVARYVRANNPEISTDTVTVPLSIPLAGLKLSHGALLLIDQFSIPPPAFEIVKL
jgi:hypothetical protein